MEGGKGELLRTTTRLSSIWVVVYTTPSACCLCRCPPDASCCSEAPPGYLFAGQDCGGFGLFHRRVLFRCHHVTVQQQFLHEQFVAGWSQMHVVLVREGA